MSRADATRYRIRFAKTTEMRYTSHLDLQRTWERLLRRADLPLLFTEGFHARVRFNLAAALPLGFTADAELCDLYLTEELQPDVLRERLVAAAPPGVRVDDVSVVSVSAPAIQTLLASAEYDMELVDPPAVETIARRIEALLASESLPRERRGKPYDLRPLVLSLASRASPSAVSLSATLAARPGATGRPDEVLRALELDPLRARICRRRLFLDE